MNPQLASDLATCRVRDLQRMSDRYQRSSAHQVPVPGPASGRHRLSLVRHRIGFTLLEAGLRLLAN